MRVRFQADADLNEGIVRILRRRRPELDFRTAPEAGLEGLADELVLQIAASDGRVLVSHDGRRRVDRRHRFDPLVAGGG